jgi:hypothetical protein
VHGPSRWPTASILFGASTIAVDGVKVRQLDGCLGWCSRVWLSGGRTSKIPTPSSAKSRSAKPLIMSIRCSIPSPAIGYCILASFILRIFLVSYSKLLGNLGKAFKLTYAKTLKCIAWPAMGYQQTYRPHCCVSVLFRSSQIPLVELGKAYAT